MQMPLIALGAALALAAAPAGEADPGPGATAAVAPAGVPGGDPDAGLDLIGRSAPAWSFERWVRGPALAPGALRGRVVLLRWWTEGCHFCESTLPELELLRRRHADDGLVVIGVFHPKPPRAVSDRHVLAVAKRLGFSGPVALDRDWTTLGRYWLDGHPERNWTSVSFLIDRAGAIRWVHGGGEYHRSEDPRHRRCEVQYRELERALAAALAERSPAP